MLSTERTIRPHPFRYPHRTISPYHRTTTRVMQPNLVQNLEHIWIITGPAGCGKTTVAQHLAAELSLPYIEGDDVCYMGPSILGLANLLQYHPIANKEKMAAGTPLTDADRWDWLITLREAAIQKLRTSNAVIVTCSALKHKYRDVIR